MMAALATLSIEKFCDVADTSEFTDRLCADYPLIFPDSTLSDAEIRSWKYSLPALASLLKAQELLPRGHILIEYPMPIGSMRADCILVGEDVDGPQVVVVELKQWTQGSVTFRDNLGVSWLYVNASPSYTTIHPCEQVNVYRTALEHALDFGDVSPTFHSLAFLHNYEERLEGELLRSETYRTSLASSLLLSKSHSRSDATALLSRLKAETDALTQLTMPRLRYSDSFIVNFSEKLNCSALFKATEKQVSAFRKIAPLIQNVEKRTCVIVKGLVGTGKTVLAMKLVQYLMQLGKNPKYYVKSAAIGQCIKDLSFASNGRADTSYLVIDEAHRLTKEKAASLMKDKHLIVFLIDDCQWIGPAETCRVDDIRTAAEQGDFHLVEHELNEQLRCGGADDYVAWVHKLAIQGLAQSYLSKSAFPVKVASSPQAMEASLRALGHGNNTCRIVAGYCWNWVTKNTPGTGKDIHIGSWQARWNRKMEFKAWNTPLGFNEEVGAIYTVQGFEYDYVGVILGPDFVLRNGRIEVEHSQNADKPLLSKWIDPALRDQAIRNIYYVLLTRAKKGIWLYAVNPALQEFLRTNVERFR